MTHSYRLVFSILLLTNNDRASTNPFRAGYIVNLMDNHWG
jgi:hypothetical protein